MEQQVWCISHADSDGLCAAAIVKERYPNAQVMITNYGKYRNYNRIKGGDLVFITDFTLPLDEFERLRQRGCRIVHIDHHKANYDEVHNQGWRCEGLCRDDYCGAALTWIYLHPNLPIEAMPEVVKIVNDYDLWLFKDPRTKDFSYGMGLWETRLGVKAGDDFWASVLSKDTTVFNLVLKYGEHIRHYVELMQDTYCNDLAYYTNIPTPNGPKSVLAMSVRAGNSSVFDRMNKDSVDAVFSGQYVANIGAYRCSMYSPDNVKEILPLVQMFGGGGHPKAGGFQTDCYPIPTPNMKDPVPMEKELEPYIKLFEMRQASAILKQWADRAYSITMKAQGFHSEFCNYPVFACNHQFIADLARIGSNTINIINRETNMPAKFYLGWCMVNTGWFRVGVYCTDTSVTLDDMLDALKKTHPEAATTATKCFGGLWWYQREIPVRPPIFQQQLAQSAKM